ncbi:MAG: HAD family hydrolase [Bacteroidota bacterium]
MENFRKTSFIVLFLLLVFNLAFAGSDPLPSWNEGTAKTAVTDFVRSVTTKGDPSYVDPADRIAVSDNDGTLMSEQPIYFQFLFEAMNLRELSAMKFSMTDPASVKNAIDYLSASDSFGEVFTDPVTGVRKSDEEFRAEVERFLATTLHPRFNRPFLELVFQPMLELIRYLNANEFKVYIVTGTHCEFIRLWSEKTFGIPPEQVVGSTLKTTFEFSDGIGILKRGPEVNMICNGAGKPAAIGYFIGKRPIAAFGNSDGDLQMLQYATTGKGKSLGMLIHHTDAVREWAYDSPSDIGELKDGMQEAAKQGWIVVDMKKDWKVIYPFEPSGKQ